MNKKILSVNLFTIALVVFGGLFMLFAKEAPVSADNADISCNSATLWGTVYTNGEPTDAWFEWGPTTSLQYFTPKQRFNSGTQTFSQLLSPLRENTTY